MKTKIISFISISCLLLLLSCVSNPSYINKSVIDFKKEKISVLPFQDYNSVEGNNSGDLARNIFELRLMQKGFNVIEFEKTFSIVDYAAMKNSIYPGKWIIEAGNLAGADYVIYGSVHDYRIYQNMTSFLYLFSWLEVTSSVGITARMISCKTGEVVWSGSFTRSAYTLNDAAAAAVDALVRSIKRKPEEKQ